MRGLKESMGWIRQQMTLLVGRSNPPQDPQRRPEMPPPPPVRRETSRDPVSHPTSGTTPAVPTPAPLRRPPTTPPPLAGNPNILGFEFLGQGRSSPASRDEEGSTTSEVMLSQEDLSLY